MVERLDKLRTAAALVAGDDGEVHVVTSSPEPGPITKRLQARYFEVVERSDDAHPEWYTTYGSP